MSNEYIFTSARLGYRALRESDFDDYFKLNSDPEIMSFFPPGMRTVEQVKARIRQHIAFFNKNGFGVFMAIELATGEFAGRCGFGETKTGEIEVGYLFLKKFWGKGLASEALNAMLEWARGNIHTVNAIIAFTPVGHIASQRVMQKAGMRFYKKDIDDNQECVFYVMKLRDE